MDLAAILAPATEDELFERYWGKACLHIPGDAAKLAAVGFSEADFFDALDVFARSHHEPEPRRFRAGYTPPVSCRPSGAHVEIEPHPSLARDLLLGGMTLIAHELETVHPALAALASRVQLQLGTTYLRINAFLSPPGGGLSIHFDADHVFVLQLEGTKRWRVSRTLDVVAPSITGIHGVDAREITREWGLDVEPPPPDQLMHIDLAPGDVLYLPPGVWHAPLAGETGSLHLSLSVRPVGFRLLFHDLLGERFVSDAQWRRHWPLVRGSREALAGRMPEPMRSYLSQRLAELQSFVQGLDVESFLPLVAQHLHHSARTERTDTEESGAPLELTRDTRLRIHWEARPMLLPSAAEGLVDLYVSGERLSLHKSVAPLFERAATRDVFTMGEACGWLAKVDEASARELLCELVKARALEIAGS